jgi:hypothetical protein
MPNYRVFYDVHYRKDVLDFAEDIEAVDDSDAVEKARAFVQTKNGQRKEETRQTLIRNGMKEAVNFTDEQLLTGNHCVLTGVSRITARVVQVKVKKEDLVAIPLS